MARSHNPPHGGKREGSGRKAGRRNKRTEALIKKAEAGGAMPLDIILKQMREADMEASKLKTKKAPDLRAVREAQNIAFERASQAAPYLHPRLQSTTQKSMPFDISKLSDDELRFLIPIMERLEREQLGSPQK